MCNEGFSAKLSSKHSYKDIYLLSLDVIKVLIHWDCKTSLLSPICRPTVKLQLWRIILQKKVPLCWQKNEGKFNEA